MRVIVPESKAEHREWYLEGWISLLEDPLSEFFHTAGPSVIDRVCIQKEKARHSRV